MHIVCHDTHKFNINKTWLSNNRQTPEISRAYRENAMNFVLWLISTLFVNVEITQEVCV